jgi:hypothetical protein
LKQEEYVAFVRICRALTFFRLVHPFDLILELINLIRKVVALLVVVPWLKWIEREREGEYLLVLFAFVIRF